MIEKITDKLIEWTEALKKEITYDKVFLFGSSIYRDGVMFDTDQSDLDLIIIIPDSINTEIKRLEWLTKLKTKKQELEKELLFIIGKSNTTKEIISIVPITNFELSFDIHKGGGRNFFRVNDFMEFPSKISISGGSLTNYLSTESEFMVQVLQSIQKTRNNFLKNNASGDLKNLEWQGEDILPKELCREAAKVNVLSMKEHKSGDQLNTSFGCDYLKAKVYSLLNSNKIWEQLYFWIDRRNGGRGNKSNSTILKDFDHLLLYELLFEPAKTEINSEITRLRKTSLTIEEVIQKLKITDEFEKFLTDSDLLAKAHPKRDSISLQDIFVFPELEKYSAARAREKTVNSESLITDYLNANKLLIAGDDQSGKTTLCKFLFKQIIRHNLVPVYLSDKGNHYQGKISNKLEKAFISQYGDAIKFDDIEDRYIVPVVDDFHFAQDKQGLVNDLNKYENQILIVDDVFGLTLKEANIIDEYFHFKICEYIPSLRNKLIRKWVCLTNSKSSHQSFDNDDYQQLDKATSIVNQALGKIFGSGIMPPYPFFILSVLSMYEAYDKPLNQDITSQGHCYQALLYMYLKKQGVRNEEVDTYINFLTELAYFIYCKEKNEFPKKEFDDFLENTYKKNFNLPVKIDVLMSNLAKTKIFSKDTLGNYAFDYQYIYYFFVGKYIAEHPETTDDKITKIIENLHNNDNAYIAVFISHHSKKSAILSKVISAAQQLFNKFSPATLSKTELAFFDDKAHEIVKAVLPHSAYSPEKERTTELIKRDKIEHRNSQEKEIPQNDLFAREMRRSIKTVEVMGIIIKNRAGSLEKPILETVFQEGMNVHLRILSSFFDVIRDEKKQAEINELILKRLDLFIKEKDIKPDKERLTSIATTIFWNTNFAVMYGAIEKIVHSLGSDMLTDVIQSVCNKQNNPASFIVKHGIFMWYDKSLQLDTIAETIDGDGFSITAKNIMNHRISNYCKTHSVNYKEIQRIEQKLKIPRAMLQGNPKRKED